MAKILEFHTVYRYDSDAERFMQYAEIQKAPLAYDTWDKTYCLIGAGLVAMALWGVIWLLVEMFR